MRYLREIVPDFPLGTRLGWRPGDLDRPRIAQVKPGQILANVRDDHTAWFCRRVEKCDPYHIFTQRAWGYRLEPFVRSAKIQCACSCGQEAGHRARALGDPQQQDRLVSDPGRGSVEDRDHLEGCL